MKTFLLIVFVGGGLALPYSSGWDQWITGNGFGSDVSKGFGQISSEFERRVGDLNSQMDRHLTDINTMAGEVGRNFEQMSTDLSGDVADILNDGRNKMSSVVGQAWNGMGKFPDLNSNLFGEFSRLDFGMPRIDSNIFGGLDSKMFGIFALPRKPWWEGDNVCVDREVVEGNSVDGVQVQLQGNANLHMQVHQCEEREGVYECKQSVLDNQQSKTIKSTHSCCHGYKLSQARICEEFDIRPTEETISDLDGTEFLTLISEENLVGSLSNSTVFLPDDEAIRDFKTELAGLMSGEEHGNVVYSVDSGLLNRRRKRSVGLVVDEELALKDILLGHISPQIRNVKDFTDNAIISTKSGSSIRMSVYNTYPKKVVLANCALITSKDHHTTNGVVHVVNKVIQPATQTIGEILSADLQFRTFTSALDKVEVENLRSVEQTFTVFVPTDKAFQDLDPATLEKVLGSGSCGNHILRSHILPTIVCSGVIQGRVQVSNEAGERMTLRRDSEDKVYVEDRMLIIKDMMATNGVIHVIDSVILPESARTVEEELKRRKANRFLDLLEKSNLMTKLNSLENFTLFLPSNQALNEIPETVVNEIARDVQQMEELVLHHVVPHHPGNQELTALSGKEHLTRKHETPGTVSCARFVGGEDKVCGGRIQTVDRLLVPARTTVLDILRSSPDHSQFYKLLQSAQLSNELTGPYTLLAPTDLAFQNLPAETIHKIFGDKSLAVQLVKNHILSELVCCSNVPTYFQFSRGERTLGGQSIHLRRSHGGRVLVNRGTVERCDVIGTDGVLHSLDTVLLPRQLQDDGQSSGSTFWRF